MNWRIGLLSNGHTVNIKTDRDKLQSTYYVRGVEEHTNNKSNVFCNHFIFDVNMIFFNSLCTSSLINTCHSLLELSICV